MNKVEAEFSNLVKAFRKRHMGRGPREIRTTFCKHWAICEMDGHLSPVEKFIASASDGKQALRSARTELVKEMYRSHHPVEMEELLGASFVDLFVDIDLDKDFGLSIFYLTRISRRNSKADNRIYRAVGTWQRSCLKTNRRKRRFPALRLPGKRCLRLF